MIFREALVSDIRKMQVVRNAKVYEYETRYS